MDPNDSQHRSLARLAATGFRPHTNQRDELGARVMALLRQGQEYLSLRPIFVSRTYESLARSDRVQNQVRYSIISITMGGPSAQLSAISAILDPPPATVQATRNPNQARYASTPDYATHDINYQVSEFDSLSSKCTVALIHGYELYFDRTATRWVETEADPFIDQAAGDFYVNDASAEAENLSVVGEDGPLNRE